ncbi:polyketide synthase [Mycobacterium tuberculosis]|nr:polyketide synthase [Mycobacterium tuberculosis]
MGRFDETTVSVLFPNNPVARESITQYLGALKSVCVRAADGWTPSRVRNPAELSQQPAY